MTGDGDEWNDPELDDGDDAEARLGLIVLTGVAVAYSGYLLWYDAVAPALASLGLGMAFYVTIIMLDKIERGRS